MTARKWMIYGATGFTGRLIAAEAVRRGHRPILAARRAEALATLADRLGCPARCFRLDDGTALSQNLTDCQLVLNCAGPYSATAAPLAEACLRTGVHYLDITGEFSVIELLASWNRRASEAGVVLIPAVGFGVVPSDCLSALLSDSHPGATHLRIALTADRSPSKGTAKSMWERALQGGYIRSEGRLRRIPLGKYICTINFPSGARKAMAIPWGDIASAYYTTNIPNIITCAVLPRFLIAMVRIWYRICHPLDYYHIDAYLGETRRCHRGTQPPSTDTSASLSVLERQLGPGRKFFRNLGWKVIDLSHRNPTPKDLEDARAEIVAEISRDGANLCEGALSTPGGYRLTVDTSLAAVEKVLTAAPPSGFWTPARAFGPDFVLKMPGVQLFPTSPSLHPGSR